MKQEKNADEIRNALVRQLYNPVRWTESVEKMTTSGVQILFEIGPNKVLTGLTKRINKALDAHAVNDIASLSAVESTLQ